MGLPQELKTELAQSLSSVLTHTEANKTIEQIDKVYDWYSEFVETENFSSLGEEYQDISGQIIIDFTALVNYRQHTNPEDWDNNSLKNYAESTLLEEKYSEDEDYFSSISPVLTAFFSFLEQKDYIKNAKSLKKQVAKMGMEFKKAYDMANEEEDDDDSETEATSEDILQELQDLYIDYEETDLFQDLSEFQQKSAFGIIVNFTDFAFQFHHITPDKWNPDNVEKVCLTSLPKSYPADEETFEAMIPVLKSFMRYLESEDLQENTDRIINRLDKIEKRMLEKSIDENNWDANKTIMMMGLEEGVDLTNEFEMKDFIEVHHEEIEKKLQRFESNKQETSSPFLNEMFKYMSEASNETIVRSEPKIGRNDLCPCSSGKKYKKCHGN